MAGRCRQVSMLVALLALARVAGAEAPRAAAMVAAYERVAPSLVLITVEGLRPDAQGLAPARFQATGSGFAIETGLVVTNYHVIEFATRIEVSLADEHRAPAVVVGTAPGYDLALLRVPFSESLLPPVVLGSAQNLKVGQRVAAVSNPMGLQHSMSAGIISGLRRELPGLDLGPSLVQFDAAINPGQSGGALVDSSGRVIGVITAKVWNAEAIAFAIPINIVARTLPDLQRMGHAYQPRIGFDGCTVNPELAALFDLPVDRGVMVQAVEEEGLAAELGLKPGHRRIFLRGYEFVLGGDIIVGLDDTPIRSAGDLAARLLAARPRQKMILSVLGAGGERSVSFTLPEMQH